MIYTITTLEKELKEIRKARIKGKYETGTFGFKACKESIKWDVKFLHKTLETIYVELINRAFTEIGFNTFMIVACEELMNEVVE